MILDQYIINNYYVIETDQQIKHSDDWQYVANRVRSDGKVHVYWLKMY